MSEAEHPLRGQGDGDVTVDDIRQLTGAATPHFALQIRNRVAKLIRHLPPDHEARLAGEREIARLELLGVEGETRGTGPQDGQVALPSLTGLRDASE